MHNASINEEVTQATNQRGLPSHHVSDATIIKCYMTCIKRVSWTWSKGCLPSSAKSSNLLVHLLAFRLLRQLSSKAIIISNTTRQKIEVL